MAIANRPISDWLGAEAELILNTQPRVSRERLHVPNAHVVDRFSLSDRNPQVLRSIQQTLDVVTSVGCRRVNCEQPLIARDRPALNRAGAARGP